MAIVDAVEKTEGQFTFKEIVRPNDYWAVGYIGNQIIYMNAYDESKPLNGAIQGGIVTNAKDVEIGGIKHELFGFSADSPEERDQEIIKRGLIYPH